MSSKTGIGFLVVAVLGVCATVDGPRAQQSDSASSVPQAATETYANVLVERAEQLLASKGGARDSGTAAIMLREAAKTGNTDAMVLLANLLVSGDGVERDPEQARSLLMRAVAAGDVQNGAKALGDLYSADTDLQDMPKAVDAYQMSGSAGNPMALMQLGRILAEGDGVPADPERAAAALESAAAAGLGGASEVLGDLYQEDTPVRDIAKAVEAYQVAADGGSPSARIKLAKLLIAGDGIDANVDRAIAVLNAAVAAGDNLPAAEVLADLYMNDSTHRDMELAAAAYENAADAGSTTSMITLAQMLTTGGDMPPNPTHALELLERAIAAGDVSAGAEALAVFYRADTPLRDPLKAAEAYQKAADAGNSWAMVELARMAANGDGIEADPERARTLLDLAIASEQAKYGAETLGDLYVADTPLRDFSKAASAYQLSTDHGNGWAMIKLARMLLAGDGVEADPPRAIQLLEQAIAADKPIPAAGVLIEIYTSDTPLNDPAKAMEAYQIAADAGSTDAMFKLADILAGC